MNFSGLETLLISSLLAGISSLITQVWMRSSYVRREECVAIKFSRRLEIIENLLRVIAERQGISQQEQIELAATIRHGEVG